MEIPRSLRVPPGIRRQVDDQARLDYPCETCGFLLGVPAAGALLVRRVVPAPNHETGNPQRFYAIDRHAYRAAEDQAVASGLFLLGIYHTHPDSPPNPSLTDAEFAFPEWVYWITPVGNGVPGDPRIWYRNWSPEGWTELDCIVRSEES